MLIVQSKIIKYKILSYSLQAIFFYGSWDWRFLSLILASTIVDYCCAFGIYLSQSQWKKKLFLCLSLSCNLGLLAVFKYFNFFIDSFQNFLGLLGFTTTVSTSLNIILPVGISFYTFQTLSYTIDIYREQLKPERNFLTFALYIAFFPQLVAGPIERATHLLPQFNRSRKFTHKDIKEGLWLIFFGLFLKIFVADNLANIVNPIFANQQAISGGEALVGIYAFAFQIFGDFAGYSSIAIGIAQLMGFDLMINFLYPYFVTNPSDFWRHWHISLSTWLRDYLYIPLGGNRISQIVTYRNLLITMLLGGLWHGAAWTFVVWGAFQGLILVGDRMLKDFNLKRYFQFGNNKFIQLLQIILMFQITCIGWLIFRAQSLEQVGDMLKSIFLNLMPIDYPVVYGFIQIFFFTGLLLIIQLIQYRRNSLMAIIESSNYLRLPILLMMFYSIIIWGQFGNQEFIYFQF